MAGSGAGRSWFSRHAGSDPGQTRPQLRHGAVAHGRRGGGDPGPAGQHHRTACRLRAGVALVNGTTPQGSGINIRGFGANTTYGSDQKIAVQIDGASVGSEELYRIGTQLFTDPLLYREVEVLRGTIGSFAYGSGIVGGVVRLETKDASDFTGGDLGFGGSQTVEASSNGPGFVSSTNLAWVPSDNAEFLLNYTFRDQDDLTDGDGDEIGNSSFQTPSGLAKATFTFGNADEHQLSFSHSRTVADDKDVPYDQFITTADIFGNVDRVTDTSQTALDYRYNPANDLIDLRANLSYADQKIEYDYVPGSSPTEGTPSFPFLLRTVEADQRYETTKLTVSNRAIFDTGAVGHDLLTGIERRNAFARTTKRPPRRVARIGGSPRSSSTRCRSARSP